MRIGQFIQSIDVTAGGTSTAFLGTLAALRTRPALAVHAFTSRPVDGDSSWAQVNAHPDSFTLVSGYGSGLSPGELGRAVVADVRARKIDLLHIHGLWSPDLLAAGQACRNAGIPLVWEPHGMLVREAYAQKRLKKELFMAMGMRAVLRAAAALVFVTAEERDHSIIPAGIPADRRHVIPLPVQMPVHHGTPEFRARGRERFNIAPQAPCIVFMGRLHHVKRVDLILDAAAILKRDLPDLRILLIGGGEPAITSDLQAQSARLGLADSVTFAGWVQGDDKWLALAAGDVLTLNSVHENFGFVAVEALCVGTLPVLTSNLALAPELKSGDVAMISEPSAPALAAAWSAAIRRNRQSPCTIPGREWVQRHLSAEAIGARLDDLYHQLLPAASSPR